MNPLAFLEKKFPNAMQFVRFAIVGVINTGVDFAVLNLLAWATGVTSGAWVFAINSISVFVAMINSYFLNKYWTFRDKDKEKQGTEFLQFVLVSIVGVVINGGIVYLVTSFVEPWLGVSPQIWLNAAKVVATALSLIWNFIGYKFWVFKGSEK